jgi:hypothetical protein
MACEKHGYTNPTLCPACDAEKIEARRLDAECLQCRDQNCGLYGCMKRPPIRTLGE